MKKVKQTHKRESKNGGNLDIKTKWQRVDSNRRPKAYEDIDIRGGTRSPPFRNQLYRASVFD